jgi:hypothetical protein
MKSISFVQINCMLFSHVVEALNMTLKQFLLLAIAKVSPYFKLQLLQWWNLNKEKKKVHKFPL